MEGHTLYSFDPRKKIILRKSCTFLKCIVTTDEIWVYHNTPEKKMASMVWELPWSPRLKDLQFVTSAGKRMATVCSDHKGVLVADFLQQGTRVNVGSYDVTLLLLRAVIIRKRLGFFTKGVLILHDSNRPQSANATRLLLQHFRLGILEHPAYSFVLASNDYRLFSAKQPFWLPHTSK